MDSGIGVTVKELTLSYHNPETYPYYGSFLYLHLYPLVPQQQPIDLRPRIKGPLVSEACRLEVLKPRGLSMAVSIHLGVHSSGAPGKPPGSLKGLGVPGESSKSCRCPGMSYGDCTANLRMTKAGTPKNRASSMAASGFAAG